MTETLFPDAELTRAIRAICYVHRSKNCFWPECKCGLSDDRPMSVIGEAWALGRAQGRRMVENDG